MVVFAPIHFIGEEIQARFSQSPLRQKTPSCPDGFIWEDRLYQVTGKLSEWADFTRRGRMARNMRPAHLSVAVERGSLGVGRFYFRVRVDSGQFFDLYYDREIRDVDDRLGHWFLYCELEPKDSSLSVDMQSFVRQITPVTHEIKIGDVVDKREIAGMMDKVKLDVVEARILTGTDDLEQAARRMEGWGCPEIVITHSQGVLARVRGKTFYEKFSNKSIVGRTGRGDTAFAAYLSWRLDHGVEESLKFAAALVSIKMETPGPFRGTLEDVHKRLLEEYSSL